MILAQSAAPAATLNTGDTAWMLTSTALVLMMTVPGLALFYGGLVRQKNVLSTLMHSFFCAGLISIVWVLVGYTLAFGPVSSGWFGGLDMLGLRGVLGTTSPLAPTIPHALFAVYQLTFAVITPALISGAFAERMRFKAFAVFMLLWSVVIYAPLAHWVWGGGWIATKIGALDFAGGTVVHISSGVSALVAALFVGRRLGYGHEPMPPHNLPFTVVGAGLLWVGWFGFNAGSALGSNELASVAFINTHCGAAAAAIGWLATEWLVARNPTLLGMASGAVAGLVAITPAAGFVEPWAALVIGLIGGVVCYIAVSLKPRLGYDDALDVVGVHLVGGTLGALLTGVFATKSVNPAIETLTLGLSGGLAYGEPRLLFNQFLAVIIAYAYCGVGTLVLLAVISVFFKVRASDDEETVGLDLSQHSERAYMLFGGEQIATRESVEPKPASIPPAAPDRFTVVVSGVDSDALTQYWRHLCQERAAPPAPEFREIYRHVSTFDGQRFRFRGGNREMLRRNLELVFAAVAKNVTARIEG